MQTAFHTPSHEAVSKKERFPCNLRMFVLRLLFIMALATPPSFQNHHNITRTHRFKNFYTQKFRISSPIDHHKPHIKSPQRSDNEAPVRQITPELISLFKKSFMNLVGSEDLLITKENAGMVPEYMVHLYKQAQTKRSWRERNRRLSNGWFAGDTVRSFMPLVQKKLSADKNKIMSKEKYYFRFNITHIPINERSKGSELRVFYTPPSQHRYPSSSHPLERVYAFYINPHNNQHILVDKKSFDKWKPQWITLNVTHALDHLIEHQEVSFKLVLKSSKKHRHRRSLGKSYHQSSLAINDTNHAPLLVTYSDSPSSNVKKPRRKKKWTKHYKSNKHRMSAKRRKQNLCQRHRFYVGFEMLGWDDWIVAPNGYEAYFCQGKCPTFMPDYLNTTNHATIQSLMHSRSPKQIPRPCCVPTKLEPLTLLYLSQRKGYIMKEYPNMVVLGCGCR